MLVVVDIPQAVVPDGSKYVQTDDKPRGGAMHSKLRSLDTSNNVRFSRLQRMKF